MIFDFTIVGVILCVGWLLTKDIHKPLRCSHRRRKAH
jgi:hypothetical protein